MPNIKAPAEYAVVFDLDGTLVESFSVTFEGFMVGLEAAGHPRIPAHVLGGYFGPSEEKIFSILVGPERAKRASEAYKTYTQTNLSKMTVHDGIMELLDQLDLKRIPLAIVTGRGDETTQWILQKFNLKSRFQSVIVNDELKAPKPDPEGLQLAAKRLKLPPNKLLYVGDTVVDHEATERAGSFFIGAAWDPFAVHARLRDLNKGHWVKHPLEILTSNPFSRLANS